MPAPWIWNTIQILAVIIPVGSSLYTDKKTREAATVQEAASGRTARTQDAIYERILAGNLAGVSRVEPRKFEIPVNAFNAGPEFIAAFAVSLLVGIALVVKTGDELKNIGFRLGEIRDELGAQTTAMVQGWETQGFGAFIYWFLENEINDHGGKESVGNHAFYIYNPTTSANVVFKKMVHQRPFPASFGGFSSDIESAFHLMWQNRQTLREEMGEQNANKITFHLLVPAKRSFVISERMTIHDGIGRLIIKGHTEESVPYAWFNFVHIPPQVTLQDVGNWKTKQEEIELELKNLVPRVLPNFLLLSSAIGATASALLFPPAEIYFIYGVFAGGMLRNFRDENVDDSRLLGPSTDLVEPS